MLPQEDYESMQETLRLLMDKNSLRALLDGHNVREKGLIPKSYSVEDVFSDLYNHTINQINKYYGKNNTITR